MLQTFDFLKLPFSAIAACKMLILQIVQRRRELANNHNQRQRSHLPLVVGKHTTQVVASFVCARTIWIKFCTAHLMAQHAWKDSKNVAAKFTHTTRQEAGGRDRFLVCERASERDSMPSLCVGSFKRAHFGSQPASIYGSCSSAHHHQVSQATATGKLATERTNKQTKSRNR